MTELSNDLRKILEEYTKGDFRLNIDLEHDDYDQWDSDLHAHVDELVNTILTFQSPLTGGWPKNWWWIKKEIDGSCKDHKVISESWTWADKLPSFCGVWWVYPDNNSDNGKMWATTFDNYATIYEMRILIKYLYVNFVRKGKPLETTAQRCLSALEMAFDYINNTQIVWGQSRSAGGDGRRAGWPQLMLLKDGKATYSNYITINDDVMAHIAELLVDIVGDEKTGQFFPTKKVNCAKTLRNRAIRGIFDLLLEVDGEVAGWCQQYSYANAYPVPDKARVYEYPSIASAETANMLAFLQKDSVRCLLSEDQVSQVERCKTWLSGKVLDNQDPNVKDYKFKHDSDKKAFTKNDDPYWARFYAIDAFVDAKGNKVEPGDYFFADKSSGARYRDVDKLSSDDQESYSWITDAPADVV